MAQLQDLQREASEHTRLQAQMRKHRDPQWASPVRLEFFNKAAFKECIALSMKAAKARAKALDSHHGEVTQTCSVAAAAHIIT